MPPSTGVGTILKEIITATKFALLYPIKPIREGLLNSELVMEKLKARRRKGLHKDVDSLIFRPYLGNGNLIRIDMISNKVIVNFNILSARMKDKIISKSGEGGHVQQ